MIIAGIIPARYKSTRLPGKPLIDILGKTMIQRVYESAGHSKLINRLIVATDDNRIYRTVKDFGGEVMMTSTGHKTGTDRICEAARNIKADIIVNIQGDEPFIDCLNIDNAIKPLIKDTDLNVSTLAIKIISLIDLLDHNKVKVVFDKNHYALYFSRGIIPFDMKNNPGNIWHVKDQYYKHLGLYVFRRRFLLRFASMKQTKLEKTERLEQLRILENGEKIKVILANKDSISVDTKQDVDYILKNKDKLGIII